MNCLLLSNNGIALNLPPSLGGSVANYNYMLKLDMIYKQAVVLPSNINNKEVVMLGEVLTTRNMYNKTSANTFSHVSLPTSPYPYPVVLLKCMSEI